MPHTTPHYAASENDICTICSLPVKDVIHIGPFTSWLYNVIDEFKPLSKEEIRQKVKERVYSFSVLMVNFEKDFNVSTLIRNGNCCGANKIYYVGPKRFDRRGAAGSHLYKEIINLPSVEDIIHLKQEYTFVAVEQDKRAVNLSGFTWPKEKVLIILGSESQGLSQQVLDMCEHIVFIKQVGSIRSMNVGCASSIAMYDYMSKFDSLI